MFYKGVPLSLPMSVNFHVNRHSGSEVIPDKMGKPCPLFSRITYESRQLQVRTIVHQ